MKPKVRGCLIYSKREVISFATEINSYSVEWQAVIASGRT